MPTTLPREQFTRDGKEWLEACCGECRFRGSAEQRAAAMGANYGVMCDSDLGLCVRHAPLAVGGWPWTLDGDWCGDFEIGDVG
jgi:hypothetical protein